MSTSNIKTLSCFVDESGDFGRFQPHCPFYLVTLVLHDQSVSIDSHILRLERLLSDSGYSNHALHSGPLIRREEQYKDCPIVERKRLFNCLFNFVRLLPIHLLTVKIKKSECDNPGVLIQRLTKVIQEELSRTHSLWESYDNIILYYDNGQKALKHILNNVFTAKFKSVDVRTIQPAHYRLFQVADLVCSLELIRAKIDSGLFSKTEIDFFGSKQSFKNEYCRRIRDKWI